LTALHSAFSFTFSLSSATTEGGEGFLIHLVRHHGLS
jgi:hypothetical protein